MKNPEPPEVLLGAYGVGHSFHGHTALKEISIELRAGEILALLGPNGSGKTTLLKLLAGIYGDGGVIRYKKREIAEFSSIERAKRVAYVGEDLESDFVLSAYDAVGLGRVCRNSGFLNLVSARDRQMIKWALEKCFCWDLRNKYLHMLSGGQRQLVALAQGLAREAKVLLLDETLSNMDLNHQWKIGNVLKELASLGYAIVIVAHDINLASEWATRCIFLKNGAICVQGRTREIITLDNMSKVYPEGEFVIGENPSSGVPKIFFGGK